MATATTAIEPNVKISATKLLINGQWVNNTSAKNSPTINPSTGEVLTQVAPTVAPLFRPSEEQYMVFLIDKNVSTF
jgi:hypothetical protein